VIRLVCFSDRDVVEEHHLVVRGVWVARVIVGPKKRIVGPGPGPWLFSWTYLDDRVEVYIPAPNLAQPVFVATLVTSNDPQMIEHNVQPEFVQGVMLPGSPRLHSLRVPCHSRHSFPTYFPCVANRP